MLPSGARILVVEDEALIADEIRDRLERLHCEVVGVADNAADAVRIAEQTTIDLVLMDIRLKGPVDGVDAAKALHETHGMPIVFLTAHSDRATLERALALGPHGYVLKPFREHDLLLAMVGALRRADAQRQVWQSEEVHRAILASIHDGVVAADSSGHVTYMNRRAEDLTGWTAAQARGQPMAQVVRLSRDRIGEVPVPHELVQGDDGHQSAVACWLARRSGQPVPVEALGVRLSTDNDPGGTAIIVRGVSELRQAQASFQALVESAPDALVICDDQGRIVLINAQTERDFGYPRQRLIGQDLALLMPVRFSAAYEQGLLHVVLHNAPIEMGSGDELMGRRQDGTEFPIEVRLSRLQTDQGYMVACSLRDVSGRRRAQQQLRDSEARFRSLTRLSSDWYWEQDEQFRFIRMSGDLHERTGISSEEHLGKTRWELPSAEVTEEEWRAHRERLEAHLPFRDFVMRRPDRDGRQHWVSISGEPEFDQGGRFVGYRGVGRDITERVVSSQALEDTLAIMRATFESTADGIAVFDGEGRILHHNQRYLEVWGLRPEMLASRKELVRHACAQMKDLQLLEVLRAIEADPSLQVFKLLESRDGRILEIYSRPLDIRRPGEGRVWSTRDVTAQVRASHALRESESRLKLFIERAPAALAMLDRNLRYVIASRRWQDDFVPDAGDLVGRHHAEVFSDLPQRWLDAYERALAGEVVRADEDLWIQPDGSERWLRWELVPWHDGDDEVGGFVIFSEDITTQRRVEEEVWNLNVRLELRVSERTAELAEARDRAERLARAKSEFLSNMSHEIRTPLHAVIGLAGIGMRNEPEGPGRAQFRRIAEAGEHLLGVVNDVLDLAKLEAGKYVLDRQALSLKGLISRVSEFIAGAAAAKGLKFQASAGADLPDLVIGDGQHLQQILMNLLSNAVKFTDAGQIGLHVTHGDGRCRFAVSDSGIGIAASQMDLLFKPFEQLDPSTTRRFGGTGLGLMLSQRLAQLMNGWITVQSTRGEGSVFTLEVPLPALGEPPARGAPPTPAQAVGRLPGLRVLSVDDLDLNQMIIQDMLQHEGAKVQSVLSGAAALAVLGGDPGLGPPEAFDVVLLDIRMPIMDGYEVTRRILALDLGLPIIGLTADALPEDRERCLAAGMSGYLSKPFDADGLVAAIRDCLRLPGAGQPASCGQTAGPACAVDGSEPVNWPAVIQRYRTMPGFAEGFAQKVVATQGATARQIREAARAGDMEQVHRLAHDVMSVAGFIDARVVLGAGQALREGRGRPLLQRRQLAEDLADALDALVAALARRHSG